MTYQLNKRKLFALLASHAEDFSYFLASAFKAYQERTQCSREELARLLSCSVEELDHLAICRRPANEEELTIVAERYGVRAEILREILAEH
uniref:Uncharacterized protein n=1 Tax=Thermogemmatispora argillosa TaxID=2045280 RepID=A0A455T5C5_9CHLR|nr:hypothetical protein KTA_33590 [Thermogemmatispora argillosa]